MSTTSKIVNNVSKFERMMIEKREIKIEKRNVLVNTRMG